MDYYKTLEVEKNASNDEIKQSYKRLAMRYHPDKNKEEGAENKFKSITEAYQTLSDVNKRREYDMKDTNPSTIILNAFQDSPLSDPFSVFEHMFSNLGRPSTAKIHIVRSQPIIPTQKTIRTEIGPDGKLTKVTTIKRGNKITIIKEQNGRVISQMVHIT